VSLDPRDHAEITDLYARYNHVSDAGDAEGYAGCFTPDGILRVRGLEVRDGVMRRDPAAEFAIAGRAELAAFKRRDLAGRGGRYRRHWNGSLWLSRVDEGVVRGRCYLHAYNGEPGALPVLAQSGVYEDTVVRDDTAWRFALRLLTLD
jgi:3-phenylpropionate/cinnamic acid dioxygenase small subunit